LRVKIETPLHELIEHGFQCRNDAIETCADEDADAADHGDVIGRGQEAHGVIIRQQRGALLDCQGQHQQINIGYGRDLTTALSHVLNDFWIIEFDQIHGALLNCVCELTCTRAMGAVRDDLIIDVVQCQERMEIAREEINLMRDRRVSA
jgi:hypothetical protein